MKRFSISFNEDEYKNLEDIIAWYQSERGLKLSRCAVIKQLLFVEFNTLSTESVI